MRDCKDLGTCVCEGADTECFFRNSDEIPQEIVDASQRLKAMTEEALAGLDDIERDFGDPMPPLHKVLGEVEQERLKQNKKWGEQNHHPAEWLMILGEEVGEANKAALETNFKYPENDGWKSYREELVQVAAVAIAMIESVDRNQLKNQAQSEGEPKREPCDKCVNGRIGHECIDNCLCEEGYMDCWECDGNGYKEVK